MQPNKATKQQLNGDSINLQQPNSETRRGRVGHEISNTLQTSATMAVVENIPIYQSGLIQPEDRKYKEHGLNRKEHIEFKNDNLSHALRTSVIPVTTILMSSDKRLPKIIEKTKFELGKPLNIDLYNQTTNENISQCLTEPNHNAQCCFDGLRIRKLTPKECWRLMGFTDEEFEKAAQHNSNSQLYKQAGNSIVVNVLEKILENLLGDKK